MRVKGVVSYDGTSYYGFQVQNGEVTIQGEIQRVLSLIMNREIKIFASGRTDRGVHAYKQVFHFDMDENRPLDKLLYALNRILKEDISVLSLQEVDESFHARYSSTGKHYQYKISLKRDPFLLNYAFICYKNIDLNIVRKGINLFVGKHDFTYFCCNDETEDAVRTIYKFEVKKEHDFIIFDIYGDGFRRYMVRMIVGTLIALGEGQISLNYIEDRLNLIKKENTSYKAPSQGLYLMEVFYG